jgi:1-acyl-sn-glycerol-3-phosphate acyltransferase
MSIPDKAFPPGALQSSAGQPVQMERQPGRINGVWSRPLPGFTGQPMARFCCRALVALARRRLVESRGWEHVAAAQDPFILAANHSQKLEALLLPSLLAFHRGGRQVHFFADWNFLLWPGLGWLISRNEPIVVVRKRARPEWLNVFQARYKNAGTPLAVARQRLESGRSVGIFPEGTVNRSPHKLLRGLRGAAQLSLETGAPVIPLGVRFPGGASSEFAPFSLHFGAPMRPEPGADDVADWHEQIMRNLSALSGKAWQPDNPRTKNEKRH